MSLSRREFLRLSGAALAGVMLPRGARRAEAAPAAETEKSVSRVLGLYVPLHEIVNEKHMNSFKKLTLDSGANTIVVDIKNEAGLINIPFEHPLNQKIPSWAIDFKKTAELLAWADKNRILVIGRQVVMEDARLVRADANLAVRDKQGQIWRGGGRIWANPFDERVVEYNATVAEAAAAMGIGMIQYDYVRMPADGTISTIRHSVANTRENRIKAITAFFEAAKPRVNQHGALLMADFFGYTAWADQKDMGIGQSIEAAGPHLDVICPMAYPGLYGGGVVEEACGKNNCTPPTLYPYEIVYYTVMRTLERLQAVNPEAVVMPWIQAYPDGRYRKVMGLPQFEAQQIGAFDAGAAGVMAWNPSLNYHPKFYHNQYEDESNGSGNME